MREGNEILSEKEPKGRTSGTAERRVGDDTAMVRGRVRDDMMMAPGGFRDGLR